MRLTALPLALLLATIVCSAQEAPPLTPDTALALNFDGGTWADAADPPSELTVPEPARTRDLQGRFGGCFACDGADDEVVVAASDALAETLAGDFTFEAWVKLRDLPWERQYYPCVVAARSADGKLVWYLDVHKYGNVPRLLAFRDDQEKSYVDVTAPRGPVNAFEAREWRYLAFTREGDRLRLFLDGVAVGAMTVPEGLRPAVELALGARFGKSHLSGWLDEVRISRGVLHTDETSAAASRARKQLLRDQSRERFEQYRLPEDQKWQRLHPRLLFGPEDIPRLREQMNAPETRPSFDRLIGACEGRIEPGNRLYLDPAREYGWGAGVPLPGEYLTELALAYVLTDRREFADHAISTLMNWCDQHGYEEAIVPHEWVGAGWMAASVALCYDWLYDALDDDQRAALRLGIAELCQAIYDTTFTEDWVGKRGRNWQAMAAGGLGVGALAIQGETSLPEHRWVQRAESYMAWYYDYTIDRAGAPTEGIHYLYYGQYQGFMFAQALRRQGGRDLFHTTNLERAPEFIPYVLMPWGGYFHNLKFGNWSRISWCELPLIMRREYGGLSAWVWEKGWGGEMRYPGQLLGLLWLAWDGEVVQPRDALPLDKHFPGRGLVVMRSGWDDDAVVATFEAGRYEMAAHDQADRGNVTLLGYRNHWLVDSGYGGVNEPEGSTSTFGHNLVVIDGKGQCLEKPNSRTDAFITHFLSTDDICLARADLKPAYDWWYDWNYLRVAGPNPVQVATRAVIFARGAHPYLLTADRVRKDDAQHNYRLFLHTHPTNSVDVADDGATLTQLSHRGKYLTQPSVDGAMGPLSAALTDIGRAEYELTVQQAGEYVLWGCGRPGEYVPGATDSFFVDLAGQSATFSVGGERWLKWRRVPLKTPIHLEPGTHTITVRTREPDAELWYLYLTATGDRPHLYDMPSGPGAVFIHGAEPTRIAPPMTVREGEWTSGVDTACEVRVLSPAGAALSEDVYLTSTVGLHPRVSVDWRGVEARFVTLSYPRTTEMPPLAVEPVAAEGGQAWRLVWPDGEDLILQSNGGPVTAASVMTDAEVALLRRPADGPATVAVIGATTLVVDGRELLTADEPTCAAGPLDAVRVTEMLPVARLEAPSGW